MEGWQTGGLQRGLLVDVERGDAARLTECRDQNFRVFRRRA
jgi:hypothetical protein